MSYIYSKKKYIKIVFLTIKSYETDERESPHFYKKKEFICYGNFFILN